MSDALTKEERDAIRARVEAASGGEWVGGPEAEAAGMVYPDWGKVYTRSPDRDGLAIVADTCFHGFYTDEEASACRARSIEQRRAGGERAWNEPAQVQANRLFIQRARPDLLRALSTIDALEARLDGRVSVPMEALDSDVEVVARLRADRTALMEVVRAARKAIQLAKSPSTGGHSDYRDGYDHAWREVHDLLAGPVGALPEHLKADLP